jgi:hypothetical protein
MSHQAPDFVIIGAQKAGTTSLYNCLKQHPSVLPASKKEIHYFSRFYHKGLPWYLEHFPLREDTLLSGEASPFYLLHPQSARRIADTYPEIKIILILRDPVERAISHYHQQYRRGHEPLPMLEAFQSESDRIRETWKKLLKNQKVSAIKVQKFSYLKRGEYLEQLQRYESCFAREQIHLMESRTFFFHPRHALSRLFHFLGIDPNFMPADLWPRKPGNYESIDPEVLDFLRSYYRPFNQALFQHIGEEFDWQ